MMYIEGHWETVDSLEDTIKIIREYYNRELADKMNELLESLIDAYNYRIQELEEDVDFWSRDWDDDDWNDD